MRQLADLAPLHQAKSLAALDAVSAALPDVPAVACFDTAFHATLRRRPRPTRCPPAGASALACAATASTASRTPGSRAARPSCSAASAGLRLVSAHLAPARRFARSPAGARWTRRWVSRRSRGSSWRPAQAVSTRACCLAAGSLRACRRRGADALEHESGLLGLAGSADMREVLARAGDGEQPSRSRSMSTSTACARRSPRWPRRSAGSTPWSSPVASARARARARTTAAGLGFLGVGVDRALNESVRGWRRLRRDAAVRTLVVLPREDLEIARQSRAALRRG